MGVFFVVVVGVFFVVVVGVFFVVVVAVFFVVVVGVFFVVVVVSALERVGNRVHTVGELEYRGARLLDCFERVFEALLQVEPVGNHQSGVLHSLPILQ